MGWGRISCDCGGCRGLAQRACGGCLCRSLCLGPLTYQQCMARAERMHIVALQFVHFMFVHRDARRREVQILDTQTWLLDTINLNCVLQIHQLGTLFKPELSLFLPVHPHTKFCYRPFHWVRRKRHAVSLSSSGSCEPARRCLDMLPLCAVEPIGYVLACSPWNLRDVSSYKVVEEPLCGLSVQQ